MATDNIQLYELATGAPGGVRARVIKKLPDVTVGDPADLCAIGVRLVGSIFPTLKKRKMLINKAKLHGMLASREQSDAFAEEVEKALAPVLARLCK